jgi:GxxExxY protein
LVVRKQKVIPVLYKDKELGVRRIDLLFDNGILVELKIGKRLNLKDFQQVNEYLKLLNLELGLLALFSTREVIVRRVVNL